MMTAAETSQLASLINAEVAREEDARHDGEVWPSALARAALRFEPRSFEDCDSAMSMFVSISWTFGP